MSHAKARRAAHAEPARAASPQDVRRPAVSNADRAARLAATGGEASQGGHRGAKRVAERVAFRKEQFEEKTGLAFDDSDTFASEEVLDKLWNDEANRKTLEAMAARYDVPLPLLAGILASEMDFDYEWTDSAQDFLASLGIPMFGTVGISQVTAETLETAKTYLDEKQLPGASDAAKLDTSAKNLVSFAGAVEAASIVAAMLVDAKGGVESAKDMATVWGAYRSGVEGLTVAEGEGGYTTEGFKSNQAVGTEDVPDNMKQGKNAFISQPWFRHFIKKTGWKPKVRGVDPGRAIA